MGNSPSGDAPTALTPMERLEAAVRQMPGLYEALEPGLAALRSELRVARDAVLSEARAQCQVAKLRQSLSSVREEMAATQKALGREVDRFNHLWKSLPFIERHKWGGDVNEAREGVDFALRALSPGAAQTTTEKKKYLLKSEGLPDD